MNSIRKVLILLSLMVLSESLFATTYYINAKTGNDSNNGQSKEAPFKTLEKISELKIKAGDKILLANGLVYEGMLSLTDASGKRRKWVEISSYKADGVVSDELPLIDAKGFRNGILLTNCSYVKVSNLIVTANAGGLKQGEIKAKDMRCGILVTTSKSGKYQGITLENLLVKDVFFNEEGVSRSKKETFSANGTKSYGWGIRFMNNTDGAVLKELSVIGCEVRNVAHTGIKFTGKKKSIHDIKILDCKVFETGGPGVQMSGVVSGHVKNNIINHSGNTNDSRKWGRGSGLWTWSCHDIIIEHNEFRNSTGPGDSAGCHIDFNCENVIVQYNISENNAGGFCEILGNNYNCAYRYNISINDGYRVKKKGVSFQEGKVFWLSGFVGQKRKRNGPFNSYFYNNTIYVKDALQAKIAVDKASKGALLANNIFYMEGGSKQVLGDQYKPEKAGGKSSLENIVFKNNLFLTVDCWAKGIRIQDEAPVFGDPQFVNKNGINIKDYIPQNTALVKDKGIVIPKIPNDKKGLFIGLEVEYDILGNKIKGLPDMGAIELR